jgi:uncharacterized protein YxjI
MRFLMRHGSAGTDGNPSIEDDQGRRPYRVTRIDAGPDPAMVVADAQGAALCVLRFSAADRPDRPATCEILDGQHQVHVIRRDAASRRLRFRITQETDGTLVAQGNIGHDEYVVRHGLRRLATVSRKGTPEGGTLAVQIVPGADEALLLSVVLAISVMTDARSPAGDGAGDGAPRPTPSP